MGYFGCRRFGGLLYDWECRSWGFVGRTPGVVPVRVGLLLEPRSHVLGSILSIGRGIASFSIAQSVLL